MTAGTGGTISGVAKRVKEEVPDVKVDRRRPGRLDPRGTRPIGSYKVEGIGYDFIPDVLDRGLVDEWIKSEDRESFLMAARASSARKASCAAAACGAAAWAAVEVAKREGPGKRIVTILPDSVRNYMTKFMDDAVDEARTASPRRSWQAETDRRGPCCRRCRAARSSAATSQRDARRLGHEDEGARRQSAAGPGRPTSLVGIVTESDLLSRMVEGNANLASSVAEVMFRNVRTVHLHDDASVLTSLFAEGNVGLIVDDEMLLHGILTKMDLVEHLTASVESSLA